ncbi:TonB-dependent receptor [Catenovulum maritimum]|uniref:TonB-dependent receptor n=1 Tax=Catenovulum maritimum TaxID=1513271 RepID=A0A0J8GW04_9ALTE|nr:TonB-dependent receptor [Catenovulum maritimum]KMT64853.1 TonB-dependent receptor [Catenovulum maritimum]
MTAKLFQPKYIAHCLTLVFSAYHAAAFSQASSEAEIEVIEVTSSKRVKNMQKVPVAIQALSSQTLAEQNLSNLDSLNLYLPNVNIASRGPGQADIFMRGMAIQPIAVMLSGAQGTMPNVAVYLDEQPVTAPGRNIDVYTHDLERVEVLAGPQGTLFGASSQAGTIRYITNKPTRGTFEASTSLGFANTKHGETSHSAQGMLNLPITDDLSLRLSAYTVLQGGYIDNRFGEFTLDPTINPNSIVNIEGASYQMADNLSLVEDDFNQNRYQGFRLSGQYWIDDDWQLLLQHNAQQIEADGVFDMDPEVGDLAVSRFFPDTLEDEFKQSALTLSGRIQQLEVLYSGSVLKREVNQQIDYTGYNNTGAYIAYYTCTYTNPNYIANYNIPASLITEQRECKDPTKGFVGQQSHDKTTHELRFVYDAHRFVDSVFGIYLDDFLLETQDDYVYLAAPELGFAPNAPISTANNINPNTRAPGVTFFNDVTRSEKQQAVFAELSFHLTEQLSATFGARKYKIETGISGSSNFADGIFQGSVNTDRGRDYDVSGGHSDKPWIQKDTIYKFNLSYNWQLDKLIYATYSEGFRPGGFNRGGGIESNNPEFPTVSTTYNTDDVKNYELGFKSTWLDNRLRFNANAYHIEWQNMQVSRFDPQNVSILTFIENAADAEINGLEADAVWQVTPDWRLFSAFSYIKSELTQLKAEAIELVSVGSALPLTPKFQGNLRSQYSWQLGEYWLDWHFAWVYSASSWSSIVAEQREKQDSYQIMNTSINLDLNNWQLQIYLDNLADERAKLFINDQDDIKRVTVNRPRTLGIKLKYRY